MPAQYVKITKDEFEAELPKIVKDLGLAHEFAQLTLPGFEELVYATRLISPSNPQRPLTLRIYSSIAPVTSVGANRCRAKGKDAIRIDIFVGEYVLTEPWKSALGIKDEAEKKFACKALTKREVPKWTVGNIHSIFDKKARLPHVKRVAGWRTNLRSRIQEAVSKVY